MCHAVGASSGKWGRIAPGLVHLHTCKCIYIYIYIYIRAFVGPASPLDSSVRDMGGASPCHPSGFHPSKRNLRSRMRFLPEFSNSFILHPENMRIPKKGCFRVKIVQMFLDCQIHCFSCATLS